MRHETYATETGLSGRIPFALPHTVNIETPGHYGTGLVSLPICFPIQDQWPSRELAEKMVLESVFQVMGAVLASDRRDPLPWSELPYLLREFEELEFKSPLNPTYQMRVVVRIQSRYDAMSRGIFVAYQNAAFIAAGKLLLSGKKPQ